MRNIHFNNGIDRVDQRCKSIVGPKQDELYCKIYSDHPKILIIGDSHAISFAYSQALIENPNLSIVAANGCLPVFGFVGTKSNEVFANREKVCQGLMTDAYRVAMAFPSIKHIVFVNGGPRYLASTFKFIELANNQTVDNQYAYVNGFIETVAKFQELERKIVLAIDVPDIVARPNDCVEIRPFRIGGRALKECAIDKKIFEGSRVDYLKALSLISSRSSGLSIYDPTSLFCDDSKCYGIKDNRFYYYDGEHLGRLGSELIFENFTNWIKAR